MFGAMCVGIFDKNRLISYKYQVTFCAQFSDNTHC